MIRDDLAVRRLLAGLRGTARQMPARAEEIIRQIRTGVYVTKRGER